MKILIASIFMALTPIILAQTTVSTQILGTIIKPNGNEVMVSLITTTNNNRIVMVETYQDTVLKNFAVMNGRDLSDCYNMLNLIDTTEFTISNLNSFTLPKTIRYGITVTGRVYLKFESSDFTFGVLVFLDKNKTSNGGVVLSGSSAATAGATIISYNNEQMKDMLYVLRAAMKNYFNQ
jgi:hypothetical protein